MKGSSDSSPGGIFRTLCFVQLALLAVAFAWGLIRGIRFWNFVRIDGSLLWGAAIGSAFVCLSVLFYAFRRWLPFLHYDWIVNELYCPVFGRLSFRHFVVVSILSGVCEESFFRGILCSEFGPVVSAVVFGLCHLGDARLVASGVWIGFVGFVLARLFETTGNLGDCMVAHCVNNFLSFLLLSLLISGKGGGACR